LLPVESNDLLKRNLGK